MAKFNLLKSLGGGGNSKIGEKDVLQSLCKRFVCGFKDRNTFGVYLADVHTNHGLNVNQPIVEYDIKPLGDVNRSELFFEVTDKGMRIFEKPKFILKGLENELWKIYPNAAVIQTLANENNKPAKVNYWTVSLSSGGSLELWANDVGWGFICSQTVSAYEIVNQLHIREFSEHSHSDTTWECEPHTVEVDPPVVGNVARSTFISEVPYGYTGLQIKCDPLYPNDPTAQQFYNYFNRVSLEVPQVDIDDVEEVEGADVDYLVRDEYTTIYQISDDTLIVMLNDFKLKVNRSVPYPDSGKVRITAKYSKQLQVRFSGTHGVYIRFQGITTPFEIERRIEGTLTLAYDSEINIEDVEE